MNIIQAIISGLIQGLTEFLPVSSSGHLVILHSLFKFQEPQILFDISLHIATTAAIIFVFRKEIFSIKNWTPSILRALLIGSLLTVIIGLRLVHLRDILFSNVRIVAVMLLITSFWLFIGFLAFKRKGEKTKNLKWYHALLIGVSQGLALIPGISRSGATISTALILKCEAKVAVYFSFLLSIPVTFGALVYQLGTRGAISSCSVSNILIGSLVAFIVGIVAIKCVLKVVLKNRLYIFSIYCFLLAIATFILG